MSSEIVSLPYEISLLIHFDEISFALLLLLKLQARVDKRGAGVFKCVRSTAGILAADGLGDFRGTSGGPAAVDPRESRAES